MRGLESTADRGRARVLPWVALLASWLLAELAGAAAMPTPIGWARGSAAHEQARARAEVWAEAWAGTVRDVMATRTPDDFVETLAVIDAAGPIPVEALADAQDARAWVEPRVTAALGAPITLDADGIELEPGDEPGVALVRARVVQGEQVARIALAPTGARHLAVVLLVPAAEEVLYARAFDDAVDALEGLRPPVVPFARGLVRTLAILLWVAAGTVIAVVWTRRNLPRPGARVAGRQVAGALVGGALVVMLLAGLVLGSSSVELA
ncbi:MAG: hypothetical protein KDK70_30065, partial [Myxococcales bacterium]|nr:hypothetical protein [Myxococcales bacterium]